MIHFKIHFNTEWGQQLQLYFSQIINNESVVVSVLQMQYLYNGVWHLEVDMDTLADVSEYHYGLLKSDNSVLIEMGLRRSIPDRKKNTTVFDTWRGPNGNSPFNSSIFSSIFFKRNELVKQKKSTGNLELCIHYPKIEKNQYLAVLGNQEALGNWDEARKVRLDESDFPNWTAIFDSKKMTFPLEYKYVVVDENTDQIVAWEVGANRVLSAVSKTGLTRINDEHINVNTSNWKGAGVAIPVFSLRSEKSFGVGEFEDLKLMVDWAVRTGQCLIQTLPINDTTLTHTFLDSYPYNAVSVYALHPIYLNLDKMGKLKDKQRSAYFKSLQQELNSKSFVDYELVMKAKWEFFEDIYKQNSQLVFAKKEYLQFFEKNKEWLVPYAAFSYLRDLNSTPDTKKWPKYSVYKKSEIDLLSNEKSDCYERIAIYYYLQFHLHIQLSEVHAYANSCGVAIKGDIPIGVSPLSVDVWVKPGLFNINVQAGAPPDDFSATGQNWGFPTYNWELMAQNDYNWWKKRFKKMAEYFDAYRIDHILGFFRIWEIPTKDVWGLTGNFNPALAFTKWDIEHYGVYWNEERLLDLYIKEHVLWDVFGDLTPQIKSQFLDYKYENSYCFKPEFDTQRKIKAFFEENVDCYGANTERICNNLYNLHCEVLFVRDIRDSNLFHPRISMHSSATYNDLDDYQKWRLNELYVDYFYRRQNDFWKNQAYKKLPALLASTRMLVCGEDLGMVPDTVPEVMNNLEILSLEIQRMPKNPKSEFAMPADAPYFSVCTTSTHDMNPIRAWWEENRNTTQRFYNIALGKYGEAPQKCEQWIAEEILNQHLYSKAMWVILPWQDWMSIQTELCHPIPNEERINVPDNPQNFWCYRMHITLESLLNENEFNSKVKYMIQNSGR